MHRGGQIQIVLQLIKTGSGIYPGGNDIQMGR